MPKPPRALQPPDELVALDLAYKLHAYLLDQCRLAPHLTREICLSALDHLRPCIEVTMGGGPLPPPEIPDVF